jgi:hypothetical protein
MNRLSLRSLIPFARWREPAPVVAVLRLAGVIGSVGPARRGMTLAALADPIERAFGLSRRWRWPSTRPAVRPSSRP